MTGARRALHLEKYITNKQYRNLGLLFITMNAIWFYFTLSEHILVATGQQKEEFVVLASKLWGRFAPGFWVMIVFMFIAFCVQVLPKLLPGFVVRMPVFRPSFSLATAGTAVILLILRYSQVAKPITASIMEPIAETLIWAVIALLIILAGLGIFPWLKAHMAASAVIASLFVLIGMWLERWFIVIPTMSIPRMMQEGNYIPSLTEWSITAASLATFALMFLIFFKLFPAVSIWEVLEGRVIEQAHENIVIPSPEANEKRLRRPKATGQQKPI